MKQIKDENEKGSMFIFNFDQVLGEGTTQKETYENSIKPIFRNAVNKAKSASILLFGASECGKTYTMLGKSKLGRGFIYRGTEDIFNALKSSPHHPSEFVIYFSAGLMQKKKAIDLLEFPEESNDKYKLINGPDELSKVELKETQDISKAIKRIYLQLKRIGPEWGEDNFEEKSHIALKIEIMRRESNDIEEVLDEEDNLKPYSSILIMKFCGSEFAANNPKLSDSERLFATTSFNGLSNLILQSALHTKSKKSSKKSCVPKGTEVMMKFLQQNVTPENRVLLLSCVNPKQMRLADTLPALKFVTRMRECICVESEKRKIPAFDPDIEKLTFFNNRRTSVDCLREEINEICENSERRAKMSKEEFENWATQKEQEIKTMLVKIEAEMSMSPNKEDSGLIEKYEELQLLKNKIGQSRREEITPPHSKLSPILRKTPKSQSDREQTPLSELAKKPSAPVSQNHSLSRKIEDNQDEYNKQLDEFGENNNKDMDLDIRARNENNEKRMKDLEEQIVELQSHARTSSKYFDQLLNKKNESSINEEYVAKLATENETMKEKIKEMEEETEFSKQKIEEYKKELVENKAELERIKERKKQYDSEHKKSIIELEKKQSEEINSLKTQVSTMKNIIEENRSTLEKMKKDRDKLTKEIQEIQTAHEEQLALKNRETEELREALTSKIKTLQDDINKVADKTQYEFSEEAGRFKEENRKLKEDNIELMNKTSVYKEDNEKLRKDLLAATKTNEKQISEIEQKYETLFTELQRLRVENAEYKEREKLLGRKKDESFARIKALEEQNARYKEKKVGYKKVIEDLEMRVKELEFEKEIAYKTVKRKGEVNLAVKEHQMKVFFN